MKLINFQVIIGSNLHICKVNHFNADCYSLSLIITQKQKKTVASISPIFNFLFKFHFKKDVNVMKICMSLYVQEAFYFFSKSLSYMSKKSSTFLCSAYTMKIG